MEPLFLKALPPIWKFSNPYSYRKLSGNIFFISQGLFCRENPCDFHFGTTDLGVFQRWKRDTFWVEKWPEDRFERSLQDEDDFVGSWGNKIVATKNRTADIPMNPMIFWVKYHELIWIISCFNLYLSMFYWFLLKVLGGSEGLVRR